MFGFGTPDYEDPTEGSMNYLNQIPGTISPYYQPYIDWGMNAGNILSSQYGRMAMHPDDYYDHIMNGYEESDAYKYNEDKLQRQMSGNAAAGGFTGTPYDQQQQAEALSGILAQDQQQYLKNILGIQDTGLSGENHLFDTGFQASTGLAEALASVLAQQAGLSYKGVAGQNAYNQGLYNAQNQRNSQLLGAGIGGYFGRKQKGE